MLQGQGHGQHGLQHSTSLTPRPRGFATWTVTLGRLPPTSVELQPQDVGFSTEVAKQMYKLVYAVAPTLFSHSGPPCLYGPCPEGKMSCKKQAQVREEYAAMKERLGQ